MDADRFDRLAIAFAARAPRRAVLRWLARVGLGAALGLGRGEAAPAQAGSTPPLPLCKSSGPKCPQNRKPVIDPVNGECRCRCKRDGDHDLCCDDERSCGSPDNICIPKGDCCPTTERACRVKVNGRARKTCVEVGECCRDEKECRSLGCIPKEDCCPNTERECRERVNGRIRKTCIPLEQCCTGHEPCPIDADGCCNPIAGERCAAFEGCCDVLNADRFVCDGKWCCEADEECQPGQGCVEPCTGCPAGTTCCGAGCIGSGFTCCDPQASVGCPSDKPCCKHPTAGWSCCGGGTTCVNGVCR